ncbi:MAG TPA: cupin domain-containing protein [Kofleriaceae bacterium]|jgi:GST-like protein|nr:cupin domain-containing protein [Kofleriaceae bacterium]
MVHRTAVILRATDVARLEVELVQRLNPRCRFFATGLALQAGLARTGVSRGRIPPSGESFAYHAHLREEEWVYILSGRASARIAGDEIELAAGDFVAFPAPQPPHVLANPFDEDCVYLMGGERTGAPDVLHYPELDKSYVLVRDNGRGAFHAIGAAEYPFGRASAQPLAPWRVFASKGCGSAVVEAALALAELPYEVELVDYESAEGRAKLLAHNPLAQVPTVIAPDGLVLTETAAIVQIIDELVPGVGLLPPIGDPLRREALRHLAFLIAAIYPTFTYGDSPAAWGCGDVLATATNAHREVLWRYLDGIARGPWFLGPRFSALDIYIGVMTSWRPGRVWFADHAPTLDAISRRVARDPRLAGVWTTNGFVRD